MKNVLLLLIVFSFCSCASTRLPTARYLWNGSEPEVSTALEKDIPSHNEKDANRLHEPEVASMIRQADELRNFGNTGIFAVRTAARIVMAIAQEKNKNRAIAETHKPNTTTPVTSEKKITEKPDTTIFSTSPTPVIKKTENIPGTTKKETTPKPVYSENNTTKKDTVPVSLEPQTATENIRTIYAKKNDDVEVTFQENGWLLLSVPDTTGGLEYLSHSNDEKRTVFYFRGLKEGDYLLPFQLQDTMRGIFKNETIKISVVPDKEFYSVMKQRGSEKSEGDQDVLGEAFILYEQGQTDAALAAFLQAYKDGDARLNDAIASLYMSKNNFPRAIYYWRKNMQASEPYKTNALMGISRALRLSGDAQALRTHARLLILNNDSRIEQELLDLIRFFSDHGDDIILFDLFNTWLARYQYQPGEDEIYYRLAKFFENNVQYRDFKKSRNYYTIVVQEYPASNYALPSQDRIDYINRHYIKVR